jgi:hypothetical protein
MRIAIIGGGIGGMALALSLHDAGLDDLDIYELGLLDDLAAVGIPTAELVYYSKHGQRIWREPRGLAAGYHWRLGRARPIPRRHPPAGDLRPHVEVAPRRRSPPPRARTGPRGQTFALAWHPVAPCSCARSRPTPPRAAVGRAPARWEAPRWAA